MEKRVQSTDNVKLVLNVVRSYVGLVTETHGNQNANDFLPSTALCPILNSATREDLSDPAQYVKVASQSKHAKATMQMTLTLCSAFARSLPVLAALRTIDRASKRVAAGGPPNRTRQSALPSSSQFYKSSFKASLPMLFQNQAV